MARYLLIAVIAMTFAFSAVASSITVSLFKVKSQGRGPSVGTITVKNTPYGLLIKPNLHGLPPGLHGFHVHVNPSCRDVGKAAGGHLDPQKTGQHQGPYNSAGHLGDLPVLSITAMGTDNTPILAPRLSVKDLYGHSLMIHVGGDNYSDYPQKLGGGGARYACGIVPDRPL